MATAESCAAEQKDVVLLADAHLGSVLTYYGIGRIGQLRWVGPWLHRLPLGWHDLWREMRPRKIRWGWALLLAIVLVLAMGEWGPGVSVMTIIP